MKVLTIFYNKYQKNIFKKYHKNENEALTWWNCSSYKDTGYCMLLTTSMKRTGHKYQIEYTSIDSLGYTYTKEISCYSKKTAIFVAEKIKELNNNYLITIKKCY